MQLCGTRVVWITTGKDTAPAGAARADGEVCVIEFYAFEGQLVDIRRADTVIVITAEIIPGNIIPNKNNKVRLLLCPGKITGQNQNGAYDNPLHIIPES